VDFGARPAAGPADGLRTVFFAGAVLMGTHYGGIDHHVFVVMIFGQQLENVFEDPAFRPPAKPLVGRFPGAKTLR
jgi:hypothetical protein